MLLPCFCGVVNTRCFHRTKCRNYMAADDAFGKVIGHSHALAIDYPCFLKPLRVFKEDIYPLNTKPDTRRHVASRALDAMRQRSQDFKYIVVEEICVNNAYLEVLQGWTQLVQDIPR
jgi:hypothetical protein